MPKKPSVTEADQQIKTSLGARIRMACANGGKKPAEIARVAGVSLAHQYRIEAGERTPDGLYLIKVAIHLGISLDVLCGLADQPSQTGVKSDPVMQSNSGANAIQVHGNSNNVATK